MPCIFFRRFLSTHPSQMSRAAWHISKHDQQIPRIYSETNPQAPSMRLSYRIQLERVDGDARWDQVDSPRHDVDTSTGVQRCNIKGRYSTTTRLRTESSQIQRKRGRFRFRPPALTRLTESVVCPSWYLLSPGPGNL